MFCGEGFENRNLLYETFGCEAVMCPEGTFHDHGHATLHSGCRDCPVFDPSLHNVLGRTHCDGVQIVNGDADGDGEVKVEDGEGVEAAAAAARAGAKTALITLKKEN